MKKFLGFAQNGSYCVGCTGQTVYVLSKSYEELARFRDIRYGYAPLFRPHTNTVVVKSTEGKIAIYDLDALKCVKILPAGEVAQDEGMCFSTDGKTFVNIERIKGECDLVSYDAESFEEIGRHHVHDVPVMFQAIEPTEGGYSVLGYTRDADNLFDHGFVARFDGQELGSRKTLDDKRYNEILRYKRMELFGFTPKALEWSNYKIPAKPIVLAEILSEE